MNRFYLKLTKVVCTTAIALCTLNSNAQNTTTLLLGGDCSDVLEDFNDDASGYVSPSPNRSDNPYIYTKVGTDGFFTSGDNRPGKLQFSILSPLYTKPGQNGTITVGFQALIDGANAFFIINILGEDGTVLATTAEVSGGSGNGLNLPDDGQVCVRLADADLLFGQKIRIEVVLTSVGNSDVLQFDDISLGGDAAIVLPVKFTGITANKENSGVRIQWQVAEESNVTKYEVERSVDGRTFTKIGEVAASSKAAYSLVDNVPNAVGFYRIKNVDVDGRSAYSTIVRINLNTVITLRSFPTPAGSRVTIEHPTVDARGTITLTTAEGRIVKRVQTLVGTNQTSLELNGLNPGIYIAHFEKPNGEIKTIKIIKQ